MLSKTCNTEKLFYSEFLYKLHIKTPISHAMRPHPTRGVTYSVINNIIASMGTSDAIKVGRFKTAHRTQVEDAKRIITHLIGTDPEFKVRCEVYGLFIYSNDIELLERIANDTSIDSPCVLWTPIPGSESFLTSNINTIVSKKPVKYEYKVTLKGGSAVHKAALAAWINNNPDKAHAGSVTLRNLHEDRWVGGNYFYIKNTNCLSIIEMIIGASISKVEKVVYINDIDK